MGDFRRVPSSGYGRGDVVTSFTPGIILIVIGWVLVSLGSPNSSSIDFAEIGFLRSFSLIVGVALVIFGFIGLGEGISLYKAKRSWFAMAVTAQTIIVEREEVDNKSPDSYMRGEPSTYWYLRLRPIPAQSAVQPKAAIVSVSLRESQYKNYGGKASVTIYYSPKDPFIILLEDEV